MAFSYAQLLNEMEQAALEAGRVIMHYYETGVDVHEKADHSPVTEADCAAEKIILETLQKIAPDHVVIAEERMAQGFEVGALGQSFFLVDPLDGTREFIAHNGEFTVNIALIENGCPTCGVVYAPALDRLYSASPRGAFKTEEGKRQAISVRLSTKPPVIIASRSHRTKATQNWIDAHQPHHCCAIGSSLKFCLIAEGKADYYPRFEHCMEWDTAAGDAVLRAAGGMVYGLDGKPLFYGKRARHGLKDFTQDLYIAAVTFPQ